MTLSLASGVHVKTVSQWAGHASAAFTLDTYAHVIPSMEEAALEKLEKLFPAKTGTL